MVSKHVLSFENYGISNHLCTTNVYRYPCLLQDTRGLRSQLKDSVPVAGLCPQGAYGVQNSLQSG